MNKRSIELYNQYSQEIITINKKIIKSLGILIKDASIKCREKTVPCIIYELSMIQFKVIIRIDKEIMEMFNKADKKVFLDLPFLREKRINFHLDCQIMEFSSYHGSSENIYFVNLKLRKKAPDDLIFILGEHIEKWVRNEKRIYQRIRISQKNRQKLGIHATDTYLLHQGKAIKCILNELSILSALVIVSGEPEHFKDQKMMLMIKNQKFSEIGEMIGTVIRAERVEGENSLISVVLLFDQDLIPPSYKMFIGEYLEEIGRAQRMGQ